MKADDTSHYLIYRVLGITISEGKQIAAKSVLGLQIDASADDTKIAMLYKKCWQ